MWIYVIHYVLLQQSQPVGSVAVGQFHRPGVYPDGHLLSPSFRHWDPTGAGLPHAGVGQTPPMLLMLVALGVGAGESDDPEGFNIGHVYVSFELAAPTSLILHTVTPP